MGALGINSVAFFRHKFRNREGDKENEDAAIAIASMVVCLSLVYNSKPQQKNTKKKYCLSSTVGPSNHYILGC
jgi:hypothetical protein